MGSNMYDVLVVGGGLVGSAFVLDLALKNPKLKIVLLDQAKINVNLEQQIFDNRVYAISPKNYQQLLNLGINLSDSRIENINTMDISGDTVSKIVFDKKIINQPFLAKIIEHTNLYQALYQQLIKCENLKIFISEINQIFNHQTYVELITSDGQSITARLLVGADGANSFVRKQSDFDLESIPYFQQGIVANFSCEFNHNNTAYQWFLKNGVLAYLPLPNQQISIVWSINKANYLLNLSAEDFSHEVAKASQYKLGNLNLISKVAAFPLQMNFVRQFYCQNTVLIGDAAHTIHPLAGQGLNLGFGDAWELSTLLTTAEPYQFNELQLLNRYYQARIISVRQMQLTCHLLQRLFDNQLNIVKSARNIALNLANNNILKKLLILVAMAS